MAVQSFAKKKEDVLSTGVDLAKRMLMAVSDCKEWTDTLVSNAFQQGAANAIVQDDIGGDNVHLTPALVQQLRVACNSLAAGLTAAQLDNLRQVARGVVKTQ